MEEREPQHNVEQTRDWLAEAADAPTDLAEFEHFVLPGGGDLDVEDAFGEHNIEYWVWDGNRLVPASPDKVARIREIEALARLAWWNQLESRYTPAHETPARSKSGSLFAVLCRHVVALAGRLRSQKSRARTGQANENEQSLRHPQRQPPSRNDGVIGPQLGVSPQHREERTEHE